VTVDTLATTGINGITDLSIRVYPNPTEGFITIESGKIIPGAVITIADVAGKELIRSEFASPKVDFNLSEMTNGFYFVEVKAGRSTIREKVLISK